MKRDALELPPLRDRLRPGVELLLVGINPGVRSSQTGHHFAGYSNRFWTLLHESGLVPVPIRSEDDWRLPEWGVGITNLVARPTPGIGDLDESEYQAGRRKLLAKIRRYRPRVVALVGVTLYRALIEKAPRLRSGRPPGGVAGGRKSGKVKLGLQEETLEGVPLFVLPNPSGRNANYSYAEMLDAFSALAAYRGKS